MRVRLRAISLALYFVLAVPPRAYANNMPALDGALTLILIFPIVILGLRLAGAELRQGPKWWQQLRVVGLVLLVVATMAGTEFGFFAMVGVVAYGITRGIQTILRGQGIRRFVCGTTIIVFTLCAGGNYQLAMPGWNYSNQDYVARALMGNIVGHEHVYKERVGKFGTLDQLRDYRPYPLDPGSFENFFGYLPPSYRFVVVLSGDSMRDGKEFFIYATPVRYRSSADPFWVFFDSSLRFFLRQPPAARFTYAADETGHIRRADLGGSRPVTRGETSTWDAVARH